MSTKLDIFYEPGPANNFAIRPIFIRILLVYVGLGIAWILLSYWVRINSDWPPIRPIAYCAISGLLFLVINALVLGILIKRDLKSLRQLILHSRNNYTYLDTLVQNTRDAALVLFDKEATLLSILGDKSLVSDLEVILNSEEEKAQLQQLVPEVIAGNELENELRLGHYVFKLRFVPLYSVLHKSQIALAFVNNITEFKIQEMELRTARDKAEESAQVKNAFIANLSHEIRTPLNGVLGFSEIIVQATADKPELERLVKMIKKSGHELIDIIDNLLEIAQIQTGQTTFHNDFFSLNELFFKISNSHDEREDIPLRVSTALHTGNDIVIADQAKLEIIIQKLLSNAYKFTRTGYVEIGYMLSDNKPLFFVRDTGPGIPESQYNIVFETFRQAEITDARTYGGAGLGLSIAKGLVDLMDGTIHFETKLGEGTTFYFSLPIDFRWQRFLQNDVNEIFYSSQKRTLLVADNQPFNRELIRTYLAQSNLEIIQAETAHQALKLASIFKPDAILTLAKFADMDALEYLNKLAPIHQQTPIVVQLNETNEAYRMHWLAKGFTTMLSRPVSSRELHKCLSLIWPQGHPIS